MSASAPIEGFSCPVCLEDYSEKEGRLPLTIYCGHSTCALCLNMLEDTGARNGSGNLCPTCRQPFGAVGSLRPNFALLDAITAHIEFVSAQPSKAVSVKDLSMEDLRAEFARREAEVQQQMERQAADLRAELARRDAEEARQAEELAWQEQRERERLAEEEDFQWALELAAAVARDEEKARAQQEQQLALEEECRRKKAEKKARRREAEERAANEVEERKLVAAAVQQEKEEREEEVKREAMALEEERRREQREAASRLREAEALERQRAEEAELAVTEERQQAQRQKKADKKARDKKQREDAKLVAKKSLEEETLKQAEEIARRREAQVFERRRADEAEAAVARLQHEGRGCQPECVFCGKSATASLMKCARCRQVFYCNQQCQRQHWTTHKLACKPSTETAALRPQPSAAPPISAIASYFQATWMVDARDVRRLPMTRGFVSLRAEAKYDAFACVLALLQAIPGLSGGSLGATLSQCLLLSEEEGISIEAFAALDGSSGDDIRDQGDLIWAVQKLLCSNPPRTTCRAPAPAEFRITPPPPAELTTLKVQIPSSWQPNTTFVFTPQFNLHYTLSPPPGSKAGDVISVNVKESIKEVVHNAPLSRSLQSFLSNDNEGGLLTMGSSRDCAHCLSSSSFGGVERPAFLHLRVEPRPRVSLEELLSHENQEHGGVCLSCKANTFSLGRNNWYFSQQSKCYVQDDSPKTDMNSVPGAKGRRTWIASLPSIFCIDLSRHEYRRDAGDWLMSYTTVDYPVRGLDLRPFFHPELPAPADACTLYDLRYVGLFKHVDQKKEVMEQIAQAAREGRGIPLLKARYCGLAKSQLDDQWYRFDVCGPHRLLPPLPDRMACCMAKVLVYQRRDVVS